MAAPPQPFPTPLLRVMKQEQRDWVTAGGAGIYGPISPSGGIIQVPGHTDPTHAGLVGGVVANEATTLTALKVVDAGFTVTVDGVVEHIGPLDLRLASDLSSVAAAINNNLTNAAFGYNTSTKKFGCASYSLGTTSTLTYFSAPTAGTDISAILLMTAATGATLTQGAGPTLMQEEAPAEETANEAPSRRNQRHHTSDRGHARP